MGLRLRTWALGCGVLLAAAWGTCAPASDRAPDALAQLRLLRPEAVRLALADMAETWPARCPLAPREAWLQGLPARHADALKGLAAGDTNALPAAEALLAEVRAALLANPLVDGERLLVLRRGFLKGEARQPPASWQGGLGVGDLNAHSSDTIPRSGHWRDALVELGSLRGQVTERSIYAPTNGETVIEPDLNADGERILFAQNGAVEKNWRLWEVRADGSGLRQVSPDDGADVGHFDPCYLPNDGIVFASTASYQGLPCEFGSRAMVCLYRLDPATKAVRQLTFEQDSDWNPAVLPNGRVMYLRWEYADQSHANTRILFHMNPDGTDQRELRGSGSWFPGAFFGARAIPGQSSLIIGVAGGHHDVPRSGRLLLFDTAAGRRDGAGIVQELPGRGAPVAPLVRDGLVGGHMPQFLHPWPLSERYHLAAMKPRAEGLWGIYLVDVFDNLTLIHAGEGLAYLEPMLLRAAPPPPVLPDRVNLATDTATAHVHDIYAGPGLAGVPRGVVKRLRVIEYYFSWRGMGGLYGTLGMDGPWDVKRVLGTVPVHEDGSAYFTIPANSPIAVQPLDAQGQALQLMRSWMAGMPGERLSCVGCHEGQDMTPRPTAVLRREPDPITPWLGPARGFSFVREVQPVLDRYCAGCHNGAPPGGLPPATPAPLPSPTNAPARTKPDLRGGFALQGWQTAMAGHWGGGGRFTTAYAALHRYLRRPGIEGDRRMFSPLDYHFGQTELGQLLRKGHHGVQLDPASFERLAAWHDLNAPFFGTWGEIPPFSDARRNKKSLSESTVDAAAARGAELRRKYVPMGPFPDYEAVPDLPPYDTTFVPPAQPPQAAPAAAAGAPDWPFEAAEAVRRQRATAPGGSNAVLTLTLRAADWQAPQPPVAARYVRVGAGPARWLSIAEAQVVSGGRNVAEGRPATQSSTYSGADASRAVDGITDGQYGAGSVTHTMDGPGEWWEVDLGAVLPIDRLQFWNRTDCAAERLAGCDVQLLDGERRTVWRARTPAEVGHRIVMPVNLGADDCTLGFVWIPPGTFVMGGGAGAAPDELPAHGVRIERGFWMSRCEVENDLYKQFQATHESRTEDRHGYQFGITGYDQDQPTQPAVRVSWRDALAFCAWLSARTGRRVTLPTEAQWEWACRAGTATPFWFGDLNTDFAKQANFGDAMLAYFSGNPYEQDWRRAWSRNPGNPFDNWIPQEARFNDGGFVTEPVGRYAANPWGLHDLHGNAWEWTRSACRPFPYRADDGRDAAGGDELRVARGGSWFDRPFKGTSSYRLAYAPWQKVYNVGFRVIVEE